MAQAEQTLHEVLEAFDFGAPVVGAIRYGCGHINDTFVVHTQPENACCRRFILQRMSAAAFKHPDQLMENIIGVTEFLGREIEKHSGDRSREAMEVIRPKNGADYYTDSQGAPGGCTPCGGHRLPPDRRHPGAVRRLRPGLRPVSAAAGGLPRRHPV